MKTVEMDQRQKRAFLNIKHAANDLIGGLENGVYDNPEGTEAREEYETALKDHNYLVNEIYDMSINNIYDENSCFFGKQASKIVKDIRFCGKEWLMEQVEARVNKMGY